MGSLKRPGRGIDGDEAINVLSASSRFWLEHSVFVRFWRRELVEVQLGLRPPILIFEAPPLGCAVSWSVGVGAAVFSVRVFVASVAVVDAMKNNVSMSRGR